MGHDSLYRLTSADMTYTQPNGNSGSDTSGDWRAEASLSNTNDPMRPRPAPRAGGAPANRPEHFDYEWDWLGNHTAWDDDAASFYERSIGTITNGRDLGPGAPEARPSALYLSTNIDTLGGIEDGWDGAGWVSVEYGVSGNVTSFTVHGECTDRVEPSSCADSPSSSVASRITNFQTNCSCAVEQHHSLRWDELNRLVEGRRFDRVGGSVGSGSGEWQYAARLRYRYDGANQRTVKESFRTDDPNTSHRVGLTVYPEHFERRGLERGLTTYNAQSAGVDATETQYTVAGTRIVWDPEPSAETGEFDRNRRMTVATSDLLGSTAAVVDFASGELLEISTYHPSGARENLWTSDHGAPLEPNGFTGKEADEEIGLTYFGERWLIPRLGRWASPDPLHVHAAGGGEALNSYHYVSGNLLQAVDPLGLDPQTIPERVFYREGMSENAERPTARSFWHQFWYGDGTVQTLDEVTTDRLFAQTHYTDAVGSATLNGDSALTSIRRDVGSGLAAALTGRDDALRVSDLDGRAYNWSQFFLGSDQLSQLRNGDIDSIQFDSRDVEGRRGTTRYRPGIVEANTAGSDMFFALGGFSWHFEGTISRSDAGFTLSVRFQLHDKYEFQGDEPMAPHQMAVLLMAQMAGTANAFDVRGASSLVTVELPDAELPNLTPSRVEVRSRSESADYDPVGDVGAAYK